MINVLRPFGYVCPNNQLKVDCVDCVEGCLAYDAIEFMDLPPFGQTRHPNPILEHTEPLNRVTFLRNMTYSGNDSLSVSDITINWGDGNIEILNNGFNNNIYNLTNVTHSYTISSLSNNIPILISISIPTNNGNFRIEFCLSKTTCTGINESAFAVYSRYPRDQISFGSTNCNLQIPLALYRDVKNVNNGGCNITYDSIPSQSCTNKVLDIIGFTNNSVGQFIVPINNIIHNQSSQYNYDTVFNFNVNDNGSVIPLNSNTSISTFNRLNCS